VKKSRRNPARNRALPRKPKKVEPDYVIRVDVYHADVSIFFDFDRLVAWARQQGLDSLEEEKDKAFNGFSFCDRDKKGVAWFAMYLPQTIAVPVLAHECIHAAWGILEACGVVVEYENQEPLTYLTHYLVGEVCRQSVPASNLKRKHKKG
jgi:hypothetical protein